MTARILRYAKENRAQYLGVKFRAGISTKIVTQVDSWTHKGYEYHLIKLQGLKSWALIPSVDSLRPTHLFPIWLVPSARASIVMARMICD